MTPPELTTKVHSALMALSQDPRGRLLLPHRRQIRRSLGPFVQDEHDLPNGLGYQRRVRLSILCVQHVLPIWNSVFPEDDHPVQMLGVCERLLTNQISREEAGRKNQYLSAKLEDIISEEPVASYVAYASVAAVGVARYDDDPTLPSDQDDYDTDPYGWDDSFYAALAVSGGEAGAEGASDQRRRDFWRWWLEQAVPQAYDSVPD